MVPSTQIPVLLDPGFESVQVGAGKFQYGPTGWPWTFSSNSGVTANGSPFTIATAPAPQGQQVAFVQGTGSIRQTVKGWLAGSYTLVLRAAQRANGPASSSKQDFTVSFDGAVAATIRPADATYRLYRLFLAAVTAGDHEIKFAGLNTAGGDNTAFIDDISIVPSIVTPGFVQGDAGGSGMMYAVPLISQELRMLQFRCIDTRPILLGIQGPDGQWWDFTKTPGVWGAWSGSASNTVATKPDPTFSTMLSVSVPAEAIAVPGISLVVFTTSGSAVVPIDVMPQGNTAWPTSGTLVWRP